MWILGVKVSNELKGFKKNSWVWQLLAEHPVNILYYYQDHLLTHYKHDHMIMRELTLNNKVTVVPL